MLAAVVVGSSLISASAAPVNPQYDDYPVQCGAIYFLYWKGYLSENQPTMAEAYRRKHESLAEKAARILEARGLSKHEANAYMQKHIDRLADIAAKDTKAFVDFKRLCDGKFPQL